MSNNKVGLGTFIPGIKVPYILVFRLRILVIVENKSKLHNYGSQVRKRQEAPSKGIHNLTFLTVEQAAEYLQISPKTVWTHTRRGLLPVCRIGGLVRYRRQALDETLAKLETRSTAHR